MPDRRSGQNENEKSRKNLVRWLVILGIGIPVLVELLTLFNLINVRFNGKDNEPPHTVEPTSEHAVAQGDTLFNTSAAPVILQEMLIKVNAQEWDFELVLAYAGEEASPDARLAIDSLRLQSGMTLTSGEYEWETEGGRTQLEAEWRLPSGDIPTALFLSTFQQLSPDSINQIPRQITLNKIPVRYNSDQ